MKRALLFLAAATLHAGDGAPFFDKVTASDYSPRNDILVEHYFERNGTDRIWLASTADPGKSNTKLEAK
jgi:hypothetical protein